MQHSSSSPDPLQSSHSNLGHSSPLKPQTQTRRGAGGSSSSMRGRARNSSPSKLLQDFTISTPPRNRSIGRFSEGMSRTSYISERDLPEGVDSVRRGASPWRIRVTVSAEPGDEYDEVEEEETGRETRTMKIPLRLDDEGESGVGGEDDAFTRGRGRKSRKGAGMAATSPVRQASGGRKGRRRSATPAKKKRKSLTDLDITVLGDDSDDPETTKPKRRRSKTGGGEKKGSKQKNDDGDANAAKDNSAVKVGKNGHRKGAMGKKDFVIAQDDDGEAENGEQTVEQEHPYEQDDSLVLRRVDPNKVSIQRPTKNRSNSTVGKEKVSEANASYPTPSLSSSPTAAGSRGSGVEESTAVTRDPTEEHREFDSILESEGFTMISIESIPSARQFLSSPPELPQQRNVGIHSGSPISMNEKAPAPAPVAVMAVPEDESDISSTVPSSSPPAPPKPPVNTISSMLNLPRPESEISRRENKTPEPEQVFSSPKLPSPPKVVARAARHSAGTDNAEKPRVVDMTSVMRAGIELQGIVKSPKAGQRNFNGTPVERHAAAFKLGNELPKTNDGDAVFASSNQKMQSRLPRPVTSQTSEYVSKPSLPKTESPQVQKLWAQQEQEWNRARAVVSRQIEMANTSQVIVIDSDDGNHEASQGARSTPTASIERQVEADQDSLADADGEDEADQEDGDIWLQEAHDSSQQSNDTPPAIHIQKSIPQHQQPQHRRRMIPSPWKRGENVDHSSTFLSNGDMSGIFWQQPTATRRVSSLRMPSSESPNNSFDLAKLLGVKETPRKIVFEEKTYGSRNDDKEQCSSPGNNMGNREEHEIQEDNMYLSQNGEISSEEEVEEPEELSVQSVMNVVQDEEIVADITIEIEQDEDTTQGEETNIDDPSLPISVDNQLDETTVGSSHINDEVSEIPPVKIPVNFGDESSLTTGQETLMTSRSSVCLDESASESQQVTPQASSKSGSSWFGRLTSFRPWGQSEQLSTTSDHAATEESLDSSMVPDDLLREEASKGSESREVSMISESTDQQESSRASVFDHEEVEQSMIAPDKPAELSIAPIVADELEEAGHEGEDEEAGVEEEEEEEDEDEGDQEEEGEYQPVSSTVFSAREQDAQNEISNLDIETRDDAIPCVSSGPKVLSASGPWTKDHYRALHRIYLKSLKRETPKVRTLRPHLRCLLNETARSGSGSHDFKVKMTWKELSVVEEFMRSLEQTTSDQQLGCTAEDLTVRLYSIILGYKLRGETPQV